MEESVPDTIQASYHQFWLLDAGQNPVPRTRVGNGLIGVAGPGVAKIWTGVSSGPVELQIQARTTVPPKVDVEDWDDVVDVSLASHRGQVRAAALMADVSDRIPTLTVAGPGHYRIRVHVRGRDVATDATASDPVERYLIIAWPGMPAPDQVHRQGDAYGAEVRQIQADVPARAPERPVDPLRELRRQALRRTQHDG
jgi:hypothetical protein